LNLAFSIDTTTLLAVFVVSLLVVVLLVMRKYHKGIKTKEATIAQSSVTEKEAPAIAN
jgi:hypothetical protein